VLLQAQMPLLHSLSVAQPALQVGIAFPPLKSQYP